MDALQDVLERVKSGEVNFKPADDSIEALHAFQPTVQALRAAAERNLIVSVNAQPPSKRRDTYGLTKLVLVSGGLTYSGSQYLATQKYGSNSVRTWIGDHLALIIVGVVSSVVAAVIIASWGIK